jgi:hypothetical protein
MAQYFQIKHAKKRKFHPTRAEIFALVQYCENQIVGFWVREGGLDFTFVC